MYCSVSCNCCRATCSQLNVTHELEENDSISSICFLSTNLRIAIYAASTAATVLLGFMRALLFCFICVSASRTLHDRMFASALRAPVRFFDTNPIGKLQNAPDSPSVISLSCGPSGSFSGRVLNRFAKDVGFLDDLLPYQFCEFFLVCLLFILFLPHCCMMYQLVSIYYLSFSGDVLQSFWQLLLPIPGWQSLLQYLQWSSYVSANIIWKLPEKSKD